MCTHGAVSFLYVDIKQTAYLYIVLHGTVLLRSSLPLHADIMYHSGADPKYFKGGGSIGTKHECTKVTSITL